MSISKDAKAGTWIVYARYTDCQGTVEVLHKRGFKTKREAVSYEREFLLKKAKDLNMGFEKFVESYLEDLKPRLKYNTVIRQIKNVFDSHFILGHLKDVFCRQSVCFMPLGQIIYW